MTLKIFKYKGCKVICTSNAIYVKHRWSFKPTKVMKKTDGKFGRWTQIIPKKMLIDGLIPFYLAPLGWLKRQGESVIISIVKHSMHTSELVIQIDDIINSPKKIGKGLLKQVLFDKNLTHIRRK